MSNQISPNFQLRDAIHALSQFPRLWWQEDIDFSPYFGTKNYKLFNAARTGLSEMAKILNLPKDKKIGIPAFSCAVMATPFLSQGYDIEWIDTDENGVISFEDYERKANTLSLVIAVHTFGQRAPMEKIFEIAREKNIFVVEDGAHFFDTNLEFCDAKLLSFGREKDVSCVSGGALLWSSQRPFAQKFQNIFLPHPKKFMAGRLLCQPFIFSLAIPFWYFGYMGKAFAFLMNKIKVLPRAVTFLEKKGIEDFPKSRLSNALQAVLRRQMVQYSERMKHRERLAEAWKKSLLELFPGQEIIVPDNFFRVILKTEQAVFIQEESKKFGFDFRDWDGVPIAPSGTELMHFQYAPGQCINAEYFSKNYVTFPTNIRTTENDVFRFLTLWKLLHS